jgi:hypothetical protein
MSKKPKSQIRDVPMPFLSKAPWAGFARGCAPRQDPLPRCPNPRCFRGKTCAAAHKGLFCQRTHFSPAEKIKFQRDEQRELDERFPVLPEGAGGELRTQRLQDILAYRKQQQAKMTARWKAGEFDGLYGKWQARGVLMTPPPRDYIEVT